jgi:hypothetical protein
MSMPAHAWVGSYDRAWLRGDVVAGVTLAAYLLPAAIGDASLAGLPPQAGLYACLTEPSAKRSGVSTTLMPTGSPRRIRQWTTS